jgi:transcriptional regulator with XRE-family HTH domain
MSTGLRLKKIISDRGIKQTWLADRAGLNRVTLARIIGGVSEPHVDTIRRLARALGVTSDYLLGLSEEEAS